MSQTNYDFAIVGAGWLGEALAYSLLEERSTVIATCRALDKRMRLNAAGLDTVTYGLGDDLRSDELLPIMQANVLILNIAPGKMKQDIAHFIDCMKGLIEAFMQSNTNNDKPPHIVFISTTSVYGEETRTVTENSVVNPQTVSAKAHVELENYLHTQYKTRSTVLRLAGLVGANRHPVRHLVKKSPLTSANKRVNLVDRIDVISAIKAICVREVWGETLHLCSHDHPSRADYYTWAAEKLGLPTPVFNDQKADDIGKIIDSTETCERLGLTLKHASPYDILGGI